MKSEARGKKAFWAYLFGGLAAGFLNGLFGSGGGTVLVPFLDKFTGAKAHQAHATAIFIIFFLTLASLWFYKANDFLDVSLLLPLGIGGAAGGVFGAKVLKKLSPAAIRKIFGFFLIAAAVRMFF
jgi:uncharacterized membrane protein YfcA